MAKIHEEIIIIKLSKLFRDDTTPPAVANEDLLLALAAVAEELAGAGVIVEIEQAQ
jgi:hypothetical protein